MLKNKKIIIFSSVILMMATQIAYINFIDISTSNAADPLYRESIEKSTSLEESYRLFQQHKNRVNDYKTIISSKKREYLSCWENYIKSIPPGEKNHAIYERWELRDPSGCGK